MYLIAPAAQQQPLFILPFKPLCLNGYVLGLNIDPHPVAQADVSGIDFRSGAARPSVGVYIFPVVSKLLKRKISQFHELALFIPFRPFRLETRYGIGGSNPHILNVFHYNVRLIGVSRVLLTIIKST
jgi:hypothetical protein